MPNLKGLNTLIALNCFSPSINDNVFPNTSHGGNVNYWTSTPSFISTGFSWSVGFFWGESSNDNRINDFNVVRLVRGGK
ncbi:MAG: DUF1566 domain-containing protein [Alcanivoracaceae bacterium]|nr:DUF1566 domain-containing protein [Alcanivoracaceae bacterium]